ncbi:hypothetical protein [Pantoea brenneri]|uniref:hypothetical protein n=1 Tax=Pantoea brenneri TaxID=472694 RepID=UPI0028973E1C|nr:hypothetical protein [Pantoea brenneri]
MMRNLYSHELSIVAGGATITAAELEAQGEAIFNGALIGATTLAFSFGKWAGFAGFITFGLSQLVGVAVGLAVGAIGGAIYGASHTPAESEDFFLGIMKDIG